MAPSVPHCVRSPFGLRASTCSALRLACQYLVYQWRCHRCATRVAPANIWDRNFACVQASKQSSMPPNHTVFQASVPDFAEVLICQMRLAKAGHVLLQRSQMAASCLVIPFALMCPPIGTPVR